MSGQSEAAKNEAKLEMKRQETYIDALGNGECPWPSVTRLPSFI